MFSNDPATPLNCHPPHDPRFPGLGVGCLLLSLCPLCFSISFQFVTYLLSDFIGRGTINYELLNCSSTLLLTSGRFPF